MTRTTDHPPIPVKVFHHARRGLMRDLGTPVRAVAIEQFLTGLWWLIEGSRSRCYQKVSSTVGSFNQFDRTPYPSLGHSTVSVRSTGAGACCKTRHRPGSDPKLQSRCISLYTLRVVVVIRVDVHGPGLVSGRHRFSPLPAHIAKPSVS